MTVWISPVIRGWRLWNGEGHIFVVINGWALDIRMRYPIPEGDAGCRIKYKGATQGNVDEGVLGVAVRPSKEYLAGRDPHRP